MCDLYRESASSLNNKVRVFHTTSVKYYYFPPQSVSQLQDWGSVAIDWIIWHLFLFFSFFSSPHNRMGSTHTDLDTSNSHRTVWIRFCKYCITLKSHPSFFSLFLHWGTFSHFLSFFCPPPPKKQKNKTKNKTKITHEQVELQSP